jgi:23S rRNA (cytosine1962-C5)-methyltransferase
MAASTAPPRLRLRVTATAESIIRGGHPWVYSDSLREQNRDGSAGELAVIFDRQDKFLAVGLFDPGSPIRVRILHAGKPVTLDAVWWRGRLDFALAKRTSENIGPDTDGYRLINGESDGWPGLVLDRYADTLVLKLYTAAWLPRVREVTELIRATLRPARLVLRLSRNSQETARSLSLTDGITLPATDKVAQSSRLPLANSSSREEALNFSIEADPRLVTSAAAGHIGAGETPAPPSVLFRESGLRFEADVVRGQKTGFFLDQRDNRRLIETHAAGADVLNAFSFSGGFSLYAARGGAKSVTDLDISAHALESARRNFALNTTDPRVAGAMHEQIQADCFEWLAIGPPRTFDLVILDPPSLAKRETERSGAIQAYGRLIASGLPRIRPGGLLLAASCSAHVSEEEFFGAAREAARRSGRRFTELRTTNHAPDHPATIPEAKYLKAIYLRMV